MHNRHGIERRRKGAIHRARRWAYGILLACHAPLVAAAPQRAASNHAAEDIAPQPESQQHFAAMVFVRGLAEDQAQPAAFGASFSRAAFGEMPEQSLSSTPLPLRTGLLTLSFSNDELRRWRKGAGLDITVPDVGQFRLNFFSRGGEALKRWALTPVEGADGETHHWSLGASIDWLKTRDGEERQLVIVPKLAINVAELLHSQERFDVCIQYAYWRSREAGENAGRVPQAVMRWSF